MWMLTEVLAALERLAVIALVGVAVVVVFSKTALLPSLETWLARIASVLINW
jgi:hypothetical protein